MFSLFNTFIVRAASVAIESHPSLFVNIIENTTSLNTNLFMQISVFEFKRLALFGNWLLRQLLANPFVHFYKLSFDLFNNGIVGRKMFFSMPQTIQ